MEDNQAKTVQEILLKDASGDVWNELTRLRAELKTVKRKLNRCQIELTKCKNISSYAFEELDKLLKKHDAREADDD